MSYCVFILLVFCDIAQRGIIQWIENYSILNWIRRQSEVPDTVNVLYVQ